MIGVPDPYWGENVHALVVPREGAELTEESVVAHCRQMLSSYKKPKTVEFVTELPTNAYGKVLKRDLREARQRPDWTAAQDDRPPVVRTNDRSSILRPT